MSAARGRVGRFILVFAGALLLAALTVARPRGAAAAPKGDLDETVLPATVVENQDPQQTGRVKVRFYWDRQGKPTEEWARLVLPLGGVRKGVAFIPEVDDEVLVVFERGEAHRPYVIGTLWNGKDKP